MRLLCFSLFALFSVSAHAQGLLSNPGFDTGFDDWEVFEGRVGAWVEDDARGKPDSGSALLTNLNVSNGSVPLVLYQCIPVESGVEYEFGGDLMVSANQPEDTAAYIFLQTFQDDNCLIGLPQTTGVYSNSVDEWVTRSASIIPDPGVATVRFGLGVFKPTGETAEARAFFDNILLVAYDGSAVNPSMSASWYNPAESGHGIMIHLLGFDQAWMCWFTFDLDGDDVWVCALGTIAGDTITFEDAFQVEGGMFPPNFDPDLIEEAPWGSITVEFTGCNSGMMSWTTNTPGFESGQMPLERLTSLWGTNCDQ